MNILDRSDLTGPLRLTDRRKRKASVVVIHRNTVGPDVDAVARWFADPPAGNEVFGSRLFPYHFFVDDADGTGPVIVSQVHSVDTIAPHAFGLNGSGIGISLNIDGRVKAPSTAMVDACVALVARLMVTCPVAEVIGHSEAKGCPGKHVDVAGIGRRARVLADATPVVADGVRLTRLWR